MCVAFKYANHLQFWVLLAMAYCQECIIVFQMACSVGTCFGFAQGMRLKRTLGCGWDPLVCPPQVDPVRLLPSHQPESCPSLCWGLWIQQLAVSPWVPMHLVTLPCRDQWEWTPSCDLCSPSHRPRSWGQCGPEFKDSVDKGCVFHRLVCLYFLRLSLKKKKKNHFHYSLLSHKRAHTHPEKEHGVMEPMFPNTQLVQLPT